MILITGSNGLVGSVITKKLIDDGHKVRLLLRPNSDRHLLKGYDKKYEQVEGDVLDVLALEKSVEDVAYIIHTAAVVSFAPRDRNQMYKTNIEGTANIVNAGLKANIKKLAFVSSIAALGRPDASKISLNQPYSINESQKWEDSSSNSHYAKTKYLAELEVWRGVAEGLDAVVVNPSIILGEGDWTKSSTQLFKYIFDKEPFYTEGMVNYVDVQDVARAVVQLLFSEIVNERFILNGGHTTYQNLFDSIEKGFHQQSKRYKLSVSAIEILWRLEAIRSWFTGKSPLITRETAKTARSRFVYSNQKIQDNLNFTFTPLENTIQRVCDYLTTH